MMVDDERPTTTFARDCAPRDTASLPPRPSMKRDRLVELALRARTTDVPVERLVDEHLASETTLRSAAFGQLRPRERELALHLLEGCSPTAAAARMGVTLLTANTYLKRVYARLGVHSHLELVALLHGAR